MALTRKASGTQAATVGTEHTLTTQTDAGVYVFFVNTRNMLNADVLELRAYMKVLTGDAQTYLVYMATFSNKQGNAAAPGSSAQGEVVKVSIPIPSDFSAVFTLKQTAGTGRSYDWGVDTL